MANYYCIIIIQVEDCSGAAATYKAYKKVGILSVMNTYNSHTSGIGFGSPDLNLTVLDIKGWVMSFPTTENDTGWENI